MHAERLLCCTSHWNSLTGFWKLWQSLWSIFSRSVSLSLADDSTLLGNGSWQGGGYFLWSVCLHIWHLLAACHSISEYICLYTGAGLGCDLPDALGHAWQFCFCDHTLIFVISICLNLHWDRLNIWLSDLYICLYTGIQAWKLLIAAFFVIYLPLHGQAWHLWPTYISFYLYCIIVFVIYICLYTAVWSISLYTWTGLAFVV